MRVAGKSKRADLSDTSVEASPTLPRTIKSKEKEKEKEKDKTKDKKKENQTKPPKPARKKQK